MPLKIAPMMGARRLALFVLVCSMLLGFSAAVDEKKFRTCQQTAYCKRNRERAPSNYTVKGSAVMQTASGVTFELVNEGESPETFVAPLKASLTFLAAGVVRLRAEEGDAVVAAKGKRWEVPLGDVLIPTALDLAEGVTTKTDAASATLCDAQQQLCATVHFAPFRVELTSGGVVAAVVNGEQLLGFEQRRERLPSDAEEMWSERFDGHTDKKRSGPTAVSLDVTFPAADALYGLPEHATSLALKRTRGDGAKYTEPYRLFNLDVFEHKLDSPMALYGAVPLAVAHGLVGEGATRRPLTAGAFFMNPSEMWVDVMAPAAKSSGEATHWVAETGVMDLFLFATASPAALAAQYHKLTGLPALPPRFAMAYHQCRWNYKSHEDVLAVNAGFEAHDIPYDILWLDIEHTDGKRYFTWDDKLFPDPVAMQAELAQHGRHLVTIIDPHVKKDDNYGVYRQLRDKDLLTRVAGGDVYEGDCWAGRSVYPDFARAEVRSEWAANYALDRYPGSSATLHVWNDMNEPSVFSGPEVTMPKDVLHFGGAAEHRDVHNVYGLYYHMANKDGLAARQAAVVTPPTTVLPDWAPAGAVSVSPVPGAAIPTHRTFVLSRALFAGTQRVGAIWTGDNFATWEFLHDTTAMLLSLSVGGISFAGADVGGFFGNPTAELLERWYQAAVLTPFFRAHAHIETKRREPWLFGEPHTSRLRAAVRQRYAHLPYLYTEMRLSNTTGVPPMRPLVYEFPADPATFARDGAYLTGPAVMVVPVTAPGKTEVVAYIPLTTNAAGAVVRSQWFHAATLAPVASPAVDSDGEVTLPAPADYVPVLYRGGHVVPLQRRPRRSTNAMTLDPFSLVAALDADRAAAGSLYIDDGASHKYQQGHYVYVRFAAHAEGDTIVFTSDRAPLPSIVPVAPALDGAVAANNVDTLSFAGVPEGFKVRSAKLILASKPEAAAEVVVINNAATRSAVLKLGVPVSVAFKVVAELVKA